MKHLLRILPVVLAAVLQLMPLLRNIVTSPAAGSTFAIIMRWGIGSAAVLGAYDAKSAASNYFTSTNIFTGTVGVPFTNNLTLLVSGQDGQVISTITSNTVSVTLTISGQTTNFAMPPGLNFRYIDNTALVNGVYNSIFGTPTVATTNTFNIFMSYAGLKSVSTNITIRILAAQSSPPVITNNPIGITNVAGANGSFSVTAGGTAPLKYQWRFATTPILDATNTSLSLTNIRSSQAGNYTVVITNSAGAITSSVAILAVTNPLPRQLTAPVQNGNNFQFTFIPTVGLTNTVQANNNLSSGAWVTFTNVPPPPTASPITVTDPLGSSNKFYRVQVVP